MRYGRLSFNIRRPRSVRPLRGGASSYLECLGEVGITFLSYDCRLSRQIGSRQMIPSHAYINPPVCALTSNITESWSQILFKLMWLAMTLMLAMLFVSLAYVEWMKASTLKECSTERANTRVQPLNAK